MSEDSAGVRFVTSIGHGLIQAIIAAAIGFGGWVLTRAVNSIDNLAATVNVTHDEVTKHTGQLDTIKDAQKSDRDQHAQQFKDISDIAKDHEVRIRTLERYPAAPHN